MNYSGWQHDRLKDATKENVWCEHLVCIVTVCLLTLSTNAFAESSASPGSVDHSESAKSSVGELERKRKRLVVWEGVTISGIILGGAATVAGTGLMIHGLTYECPDGPRGCGAAGVYRMIFGGMIAGVGVPVTGVSIAGYVTSHRRKQEVKEKIRKRRSGRRGKVRLNFSIVPGPNGVYGGVGLRF